MNWADFSADEDNDEVE